MTDIVWGVGGAWNFGYISGTTLRVERMKTLDKQLIFLISDDEHTYLHCDAQRFGSMKELEDGIIRWAIQAGRLNYLQ
jgi:hypothetical protein